MSEQGSTAGERSGTRGRRRQKAAAPAEVPDEPARDPLTGLPSRTILHDWLNEASIASRPSSTRVILAFIDLDSLRDVNDSFGPDAGDYVLRAAGERLLALNWEGTQVLRWGGAELAVVVPGVGSVDAPDQIARVLLETVSAPYQLGSQPVTVASHLGLAIASDGYATLGELVRDAHHALVSARDRGPGIYVIHDESKRGRYSTRIDEARLYSALESREFLLYWQPIVRASTRELFGAEALIRWQAPGATNTGVMFPHDFLPLLEKSGLIVPVGQWVLTETCRQAITWQTAHPSAVPLFVTCNVGPRQLAMPGFDDSVLQVLATSGLPPDRLCLDITEEAVRYNGSTSWQALRRLKDAGVKLGLGNFGTGVASLAAMRDMRLDLVRIDRVFVQELAMSREDQAIIRHTTNLAHELGMLALAEGIENEAQAEVLVELGVDLAQGYLYGRPDTAAHIDSWLAPPEPSTPYPIEDSEAALAELEAATEAATPGRTRVTAYPPFSPAGREDARPDPPPPPPPPPPE